MLSESLLERKSELDGGCPRSRAHPVELVVGGRRWWDSKFGEELGPSDAVPS